MHPIIAGEIAAQRIAVPRQQAAGQRLVGQFRAAGPVSRRRPATSWA